MVPHQRADGLWVCPNDETRIIVNGDWRIVCFTNVPSIPMEEFKRLRDQNQKVDDARRERDRKALRELRDDATNSACRGRCSPVRHLATTDNETGALWRGRPSQHSNDEKDFDNMTTTTQGAAGQAGKLATGADIKAAKAGAKLRFGGGLYLLVGAGGAKSWQVHYHVAGKHQATIIGRWPDLGIVEAKAKRDELRRTIREGGDPAHDRQEARTERREADAATVRVIGAAWIASAQVARRWSAGHLHGTTLRLANHVYPVIGDRPIGRVTVHEIEALILNLSARFRAQAVHVRQALQLLFDYAARRDLIPGGVNPVRKIAEDLPKRGPGDDVSQARVGTIEEARTVLRAVEATRAGPFLKLAHRLIALTAVRKLEGVEARWSEVVEDADGMTWKIPGERMKGRRGAKRDHVIPLVTPGGGRVPGGARAPGRGGRLLRLRVSGSGDAREAVAVRDQ